MLLTAKLPTKYWSYAIQYALWLINRTPTRVLVGGNFTPYEAWTSRKASLNDVHTFGCMAIGYTPKIKRDNKFSNTGRWLCFLGMSSNRKGWLLVDPRTSGEVIVRSARFHDTFMLSDWKEQQRIKPHEVDAHMFDVISNDPAEQQPTLQPAHEIIQGDDLDGSHDPQVTSGPNHNNNQDSECDSPLDLCDELEDMAETHVAPRRSTRSSTHQGAPSKGEASSSKDTSTTQPNQDELVKEPTTRFQDLLKSQEVYLTITNDNNGHSSSEFYSPSLKALVTMSSELPPEPSTVKDALSGVHAEEWKRAMDAEMETLTDRDTWELVELPPRQRPVGVKWVLKIKTKVVGSLDKFKARLVAKGFTQVYLTDYRETFAPLSDYTTARLLAVMAVKRYELVQLDIKNAFLYGNMDAIVYMEQPEGYNDGTNRVCKLVKSSYGLKESPRMWYQRLSEALIKIGFTKSINDEALFIIPSRDTPVWCLVYVDDILMTSPSKEEIERCVSNLKKDFTLTITMTVTQFLGMNVTHNVDSGEVTISCTKYLEKLEK
jgi:hypothetical protein